MLPILFGLGVIAVIVGVAMNTSHASEGGGGTQSPSQVPPLGPAPTLPPSVPDVNKPPVPNPTVPVPPGTPASEIPASVKAATDAINKNTATPELLQKAIDDAEAAGLDDTARWLAQQLDKLVTKVIPDLVKAPNKSSGIFHGTGPSATGTGVPTDPTDGKTLWYPVKTSSGSIIIKPRYPSVLVMFKALQSAIGISSPDGDLGPGTFSAFKSKTASYATAPVNVYQLAANAQKWTEILNKNYAKEVVGYDADDSF